MVDVIDFKDLSTHLVDKHDASILGNLSVEEQAREKKSMKSLATMGVIVAVASFIGYMFLFHRSASSGQMSAYQAENAPIFTSIQQEFKNLKSVSCDEGERKDCISYTLTFYPQTLDESGAGVGVTQSEVDRLGGFFSVILQSKLRHLATRKDNLTFTIDSKNVNATGAESSVKYSCVEYYGQIQCTLK